MDVWWKSSSRTHRGAEQPSHCVMCGVTGLGCMGKILSENSHWEWRHNACGSERLCFMNPRAPSSPFSLVQTYILLSDTSYGCIRFIQQTYGLCQAQKQHWPLHMPFLCLLLKQRCGGRYTVFLCTSPFWCLYTWSGSALELVLLLTINKTPIGFRKSKSGLRNLWNSDLR